MSYTDAKKQTGNKKMKKHQECKQEITKINTKRIFIFLYDLIDIEIKVVTLHSQIFDKFVNKFVLNYNGND